MMIRITFGLVISLAFIFSPTVFAGPVQISPDSMRSLLRDPRYQGHIKVQRVLLAQSTPENKKKKKEEAPNELDVVDRIDVGTSVYPGSGSDEFALILFAIVGVTMIVAWIPYFPLLAYEAITTRDKETAFNHLLTLKYDFIAGSLDSIDSYSGKAVTRNGLFTGANYGFYINREGSSYAKVGVAVESGYYKLKENISQSNEGQYWFIGPSLIYGSLMKDSLYGRLDLLGGSTFDSNYGLISKAELSGNWMVSPGMTVGLGIGALYLRVKEDRGVVSSTNQLGIQLGVNVGAKF